MRIGISTASFYSRSCTEDSVTRIGALGAKVCEIFLDTYSEYEPEFGLLLRNRAEQAGLEVVSVHAMSQQFEPQLFSLSRRQRDDAWALLEKVFRQGQLLGAKNYVMHGPALLKGALRNAQLARIGPIVDEIARLAGEYGLRLCWENVSWCMFSRPEFAQEILNYSRDENLCFTLDIKQAARSGRDPFEYLSAMGSRLAHVHLCDYRRENGALQLALPGRGEFDFVRLGRKLRSAGYQGDAILEPYSDLYGEPEEIAESMRWLQKTMGT